MDKLSILISLLIIFVPSAVVTIAAIFQSRNMPKISRQSEDNFSVFVSDAVVFLGVILTAMYSLCVLIPTFFGKPHLIMYIFFGVFIWFGIYLIVKPMTFRISVKGEKITVYTLFRKPYVFTLWDIVSVKHQTKKNMTKSERVVIKTRKGRKVIAESAEVSYKRLFNALEAKLDKSLWS